jgi:hypothetical protein
MKIFPLLALLLTSVLNAQWQTETYSLKGGWNSIYLHGDAGHATIDTLFASNLEVEEVWRWIPNPSQVGFTTSPLIPASGTPEWVVWTRDGGANTLTTLAGQSAYLVKCAGTASSTYAVPIVQRPLTPSTNWVRNGANFLGFPATRTSTVKFSNYFSTFSAATAANTKIFKYIGGGLSAANPLQIFSPTNENVDRNQAYWFDSKVVGNFYAPVQITFSSATGLDFGRTGSRITARVLNRRNTPMTLSMAPVTSNTPPTGQEGITGAVPLTRRTFDAGSASFIETPLVTQNIVIAPQSTIELTFGIDRGAMGGTPDALFASMVRFTDAANEFDILIPAVARKSSLAGLWIGEALVSAVESKAQADAVTPTKNGYPLRYIIHVSDDGTARILSQVFLGTQAALPNNFGLCTKESGLKADSKATAKRIVSVHMPLDRVLTGTGTVALGSDLTSAISIPFDDPTNPFVHQYHPDHNNLDEKGNPLGAGFESYTIERQLTFTFTATPPAGSSVTSGWGSSVIGGTYAEVVQGLHKDSAGVGTGDGLHLTGTFELRRASELGTLTIN